MRRAGQRMRGFCATRRARGIPPGVSPTIPAGADITVGARALLHRVVILVAVRRAHRRRPIRWVTVTIPSALLVLVVLLAATLAAGLLLRWRSGRPRPVIAHEVVDPARLGADRLGDRATLLQFSTQLCTRCPGVHRILSSVAKAERGVLHLDVDLTHRPDIAKHFHVLQTPTTMILDRHGVVQTRFGGAPSRDVVELELARIAGADA